MSDDKSPEPTFSEALSAAARNAGIGKVAPGETPSAAALLTAIGGVRGIVEALLPGFLFVAIYSLTLELAPAVLVPVGIAVVFVLVRAFTKTPLSSAVVGLVGIGLSAGLALVSGRAEENFVLGFILNAGYVVVLLGTLVARWPLIGVIVALLRAEGTTWRADRAKFRVAVVTTVLWTSLFALRLAVQVPLYLAGQVQALGATKLIMGLPLYAAVLWITWLLVRTVYAKPTDDAAATDTRTAAP